MVKSCEQLIKLFHEPLRNVFEKGVHIIIEYGRDIRIHFHGKDEDKTQEHFDALAQGFKKIFHVDFVYGSDLSKSQIIDTFISEPIAHHAEFTTKIEIYGDVIKCGESYFKWTANKLEEINYEVFKKLKYKEGF
jgi:hypothetical protein